MAAKLAFHGMHSLAASLMAQLEFWKAVLYNLVDLQGVLA
jgi:hypothetical protein